MLISCAVFPLCCYGIWGFYGNMVDGEQCLRCHIGICNTLSKFFKVALIRWENKSIAYYCIVYLFIFN